MTTNFSLSSFFVIFNFAVFCLLVIYAFKKFLKPPLQEIIAHEVARLPNLYKAIETAQLKRENLETTRKQQAVTIAALLQKLHDWRSVIFLKNRAAQEEQAHINAHVAVKNRRQSDNYSQLILKNKIAHPALAASKKELEEFYRNKAAQEYYTQAIFSFITHNRQS